MTELFQNKIICLKNKKNKVFFYCRKAEKVIISTYTIRNVKENLSGRRKLIPDGNMDLHPRNVAH